MRRPFALVMVFALTLLACGEIERRGSIEGRVTGADGAVPPLAHVHVLPLGDDLRATIESVQIGEDGSFMLELPGDGYFDLLVTAVNHRPLRIPLVADEPFALTGLRIAPAPYQYNDPLEDIRVIGD